MLRANAGYEFNKSQLRAHHVFTTRKIKTNENKTIISTINTAEPLNPFRTAVPFWVQNA